MLISSNGEIIDSRNISPVPLGWYIFIWEIFIGKRVNDVFDIFIRSNSNAWSLIDLLVFRGVVSGLCVIPFISAPCIFGHSPRTIAFDSKVINSSNQFKISTFSPIAAPWISDDPIFDSIFLSPTCNTYVMVIAFFSRLVDKNSPCIVVKFWN